MVKLDFGSGFSNLGAFALVAGSTLILTMIFSTATHRLVENPGIALGRALIRKSIAGMPWGTKSRR